MEELKALLALERTRQEEQNGKIAAKMHNDVSQTLAVITMEMALLQGRLSASHSEADKVSDLLELVGSVNQAVRKISSELRPKILDEFGLMAALQFECRRVKIETGVNVVVEKDLPDVSLPRDVMIEVFRLFQGILSIVIGQGEAEEVRVGIQVNKNTLLLAITGSCRRIPDERAPGSASLEILGAQERALWVGGKLKVERGSQGMAINFSLSIPPQGNQNLTNPFSMA